MDFDMTDIEIWLSRNSSTRNSSIHIEEFSTPVLNKQRIIFEQVKYIFICGCKWMLKNNVKNRLFEVHVELTSESDSICLVPDSLELLIDSIEIQGSPEFFTALVEHKPYLPNQVRMEYYQSPFPFKIDFDDIEGVFSCYNEYRSIEENLGNCPFTRWFILSYRT
jgi:hypothetical protein